MKTWLLVKQARTIMNKTQKELASIMGVHKTEVSKWEIGNRELPESKIFELMYFFEMATCDGEKTMVLFAPYVREVVRRRK